jgi:hypothetical protein
MADDRRKFRISDCEFMQEFRIRNSESRTDKAKRAFEIGTKESVVSSKQCAIGAVTGNYSVNKYTNFLKLLCIPLTMVLLQI